MKLLDRYIGVRFLATFSVIIALLIAISIIIDLTENLDNMLEHNAPALPILKYYLAFIPWITSLFAPLFVFIAVIFMTSRLTNNNEIIAMVSGGVNFYRLLVPFIVTGGIIATLFYLSNHYLLPRANASRIEFQDKWLGKDRKKLNNIPNIHMQLDDNRILYVRNFSRSSNLAYDVQIETFDGNDVIEKLSARQMKYVDSLDHWVMTSVTDRTFENTKETLTKERERIVNFDLVPNDFEYMDNVNIVKDARETMTTDALNQQIEREKKKGSNILQYFQIEKSKRTATPIAILIFTIMGVAISSRKVRGGIGLHMAFGLLLSVIFIFLLNFAETIGESYPIPANVSIWFPNILFLIITFGLVFKAQK